MHLKLLWSGFKNSVSVDSGDSCVEGLAFVDTLVASLQDYFRIPHLSF